MLLLLLEQGTHDKGSCSGLDNQWPVCVAGNREEREEGEFEPEFKPPSGSPYEAAQKNRRFQVYVHSKLMIVDDEVWDSPDISVSMHPSLFTLEPRSQCMRQPRCTGFIVSPNHCKTGRFCSLENPSSPSATPWLVLCGQ